MNDKEARKLALEALNELNEENSYWWQEIDESTLRLTDEEIDYQAKKDDHGFYFALGALWAQSKLKEKNNGS